MRWNPRNHEGTVANLGETTKKAENDNKTRWNWKSTPKIRRNAVKFVQIGKYMFKKRKIKVWFEAEITIKKQHRGDINQQ